jgi:hypothetical protein
MSFVKWLRKNNTKIMAVVVIILMVAFIGGSSLSYMLRPHGGINETIATIGGNIKVKRYDLITANNELEILRTLRADSLLKMIQVPLFQTPDLQAFFLGELLFSEQRSSPDYINYIKRSIGNNLYSISEKQINDIYRRSIPETSIYWYCLKHEAQAAGIRVSRKDAGELLGQIMPQLFNGAQYTQVMNSVVNSQGISEQQILDTFSSLLSILQYARLMCSDEDMTIRQLMQMVAWENEKINVEFVELNCSDFTGMQAEPDPTQMLEQFEKYKSYFADDVSDENPYGLGYKLPDRVQLEYIVVKLDDVLQIVPAPTQEEIDQYYDRYKEQLFTEQVHSDPNDPNSALINRVKPPSAVVDTISKQLLQDKINAKAESIIREAGKITEASLEDLNDAELEKLSPEKLAELAGNYQTTAEQLSKKNKIKVYTGKTGLLNAIDMQTDEYLSRLYLQGYGQNPISLTKAVFAVDSLGASELGPYDIQKPRMYANLGPARDMLGLQGGQGEIVALVRIIQAIKAAEPANIDVTFSTRAIVLDPNEQQTKDDVFSVKEQVIEDLKKLAAQETVKNKAGEFIELAQKEGWQSAVDQFNELYGQEKDKDPNDPNAVETAEAEKDLQETFKLENLTGLRRISKETLNIIAMQSSGNPAAEYFSRTRQKSALLTEQLYALVPADSNSVKNLPMVMEFKPDLGYYCIKNLNITRIWKQDYDQAKARRLYTEDTAQSQSMSAVYFNPENILKRLNFKLASSKDRPRAVSNPEVPVEEDE